MQVENKLKEGNIVLNHFWPFNERLIIDFMSCHAWWKETDRRGCLLDPQLITDGNKMRHMTQYNGEFGCNVCYIVFPEAKHRCPCNCLGTNKVEQKINEMIKEVKRTWR